MHDTLLVITTRTDTGDITSVWSFLSNKLETAFHICLCCWGVFSMSIYGTEVDLHRMYGYSGGLLGGPVINFADYCLYNWKPLA